MSRTRRLSPGGLGRATLWSVATLLLLAILYVLLVQVGALANPLGPQARGDLQAARGPGKGLRVLFVGNSFTFDNAMPELVDALATDLEGRPVHVVEYAAPGWSLREAAADRGLRDVLLEIDWDVVVLQESSRMASLPQDVRESELFPFLQRLEADVRARGARPVLFETWAYRSGDEDVPGDSFRSMAARLERGFEEQSARLGLETAPVGTAWVEALRGRPDLALWAGDGRHPAAAGSFLAACVLAAVLTRADPSASDVTGGLALDEARYLQAVAGTVLHD